jgi:hypothetical protein
MLHRAIAAPFATPSRVAARRACHAAAAPAVALSDMLAALRGVASLDAATSGGQHHRPHRGGPAKHAAASSADDDAPLGLAAPCVVAAPATTRCADCGKAFSSADVLRLHAAQRHTVGRRGGARQLTRQTYAKRRGAANASALSAQDEAIPADAAATDVATDAPAATAVKSFLERDVADAPRTSRWPIAAAAMEVAEPLQPPQDAAEEALLHREEKLRVALRAVRAATALRRHWALTAALNRSPAQRDDADQLSDPFAPEHRTFGFHTERQLAVPDPAPVQVCGGSATVAVTGTVTAIRVGRVVGELCAEVSLVAYAYNGHVNGTSKTAKDNVNFRVFGGLAAHLRRVLVGDALTLQGAVGLHPSYELATKRWRDNAVVHVRAPTGAVSVPRAPRRHEKIAAA